MAAGFCRKCGAPLADGARLCKYCLEPVAEPEDGAGAREGAVVEDGAVAVEGGTVVGDGAAVMGKGAGAEDGAVAVEDAAAAEDGRNAGMSAGRELDLEKGNEGQVRGNPHIIYGALAYLGIAVLVPILFRMNVKFVRFHVNQGLVLFITESLLSVLYGFVGGIPILAMVVSLLRLLCVAFMLFGVVSAVRGQEKPLPVVGKIHLIRES